MNDAVSATAAIPAVRLAAPISVALSTPLRGDAPPALTQLPPGQSVQATVMSHPDAGIMQLKTNLGTFTLRMAVPIPEGTVITLQTMGGQVPQMRIVMIDGKPAAQFLNQLNADGGGTGASGGGATGSASTSQSGTVTSSVVASPQGGLSAVVLRTAEAALSSQGTGSSWPPGTTLTVRILDVGIPSTSGTPQVASSPATPAATSPAPAPSVQSSPAVPSPIPASPSGPAPAASGGGLPSITIPAPVLPSSSVASAPGSVSVPPAGATGSDAPPATTSAPAAPAPVASSPPVSNQPAPNVLSGTVVGQSAGGQPLIQTNAGLLMFSAATSIPQGAPVVLEVTAVSVPSSAGAPTSLLPASPVSGWQGLTDAFNVLRVIDPAGAQAMLNALPAPDARMASAMAALVTGVRNSAAAGVFAPAFLQAVERLPGGERLVRSLKRDLADARGALDRPTGPGGEWRALTLPFNSGYTIEPIRLYVRPPPPEEEKEKRKGGGEGTRFVVDVTLSTLGPLQLDGLVQREQKRFDMVIRTRIELPEEMQRGIEAVFLASCRALDMLGVPRFQVTSDFFEIAQTEAPTQNGILA